jgi:hypothetical protein
MGQTFSFQMMAKQDSFNVSFAALDFMVIGTDRGIRTNLE